MELKFWGIFSSGSYPSLTTSDKQLHAHGPKNSDHLQLNTFGIGKISRKNEKNFWEAMAYTLAFLEKEIPGDSFTLVLDNSPVV